MDDDAEDESNGEGGADYLFKPEDLEQYLDETPKPLVIDVEPLRICSEKVELIRNEVIRIIKKTLEHICALLPTMPLGRHLCLVILRKLPGSIFLDSRQTPWGQGAALLYRGIRNTLATALQENGIPAELVPFTDGVFQPPEAPTDPHSLLSVNLVVENDPDSTIVIAPEDTEMTDDGNYHEDTPFFYEKSEFHIYGTKWRNPPSPLSPPWNIPPVDFLKDHV